MLTSHTGHRSAAGAALRSGRSRLGLRARTSAPARAGPSLSPEACVRDDPAQLRKPTGRAIGIDHQGDEHR